MKYKNIESTKELSDLKLRELNIEVLKWEN